MQTVHKAAIAILIGLSFAAGLGLRTHTDPRLNRQPSIHSERGMEAAPGPRLAATGLEGAANIDLQPVQTLYMVLTRVRGFYVEQLTPKIEGDMTRDALRTMLASLKDPNTRLIEPDEMKAINDARKGKFHGLGAMLGIRSATNGSITEEQLVIVSPIAGGAASEAKLLPGDVIAAVDGKIVLPFDPFQRATKLIKDSRTSGASRTQLRKSLESEQKRINTGISIPNAEKTLTTQDSKTVELTLRRKGNPQPLKVKVALREFTVDLVTGKMPDDKGYGYIKINCLCAGTADEFGAAIAEIKNAGAKSLTLDLRDLSGGEPGPALDVAKYFAPRKNFGYLAQSHGRRSTLTIPSVPAEDVWTAPLVVLIDSGTARTAEVLAAALKNEAGAKLVGEKTYGDSAYTSLFVLDDGSAIVMTTGKFLTSRNADFTGRGIAADVRAQRGPGSAETVGLAPAGRNRS